MKADCREVLLDTVFCRSSKVVVREDLRTQNQNNLPSRQAQGRDTQSNALQLMRYSLWMQCTCSDVKGKESGS